MQAVELPPCSAAKRSTKAATSAIIVSNISRLTVTPPCRSASVTTPIGSETQARISGCGGPWRVGSERSEPHQFRRAAADVEQDDALGLRIDQRRAAGRGEPRFGFAIDDLELDADLVAHAVRGNRGRSRPRGTPRSRSAARG